MVLHRPSTIRNTARHSIHVRVCLCLYISLCIPSMYRRILLNVLAIINFLFLCYSKAWWRLDDELKHVAVIINILCCVWVSRCVLLDRADVFTLGDGYQGLFIISTHKILLVFSKTLSLRGIILDKLSFICSCYLRHVAACMYQQSGKLLTWTILLIMARVQAETCSI